MAGTTTNFVWPFPTNADVPNVAVDIQALAAAIDASIGNAFSSFTPAWTSTGTAPVLGNGTFVGHFKRFGTNGKWGIYIATLTLGTTSTVGTGNYRFSLPAGWTMSNPTAGHGDAAAYDQSANTLFVGQIWQASATTIVIRTHAAAGEISATVPFVPATSDVFQIHMLTELT